MKRSLSPLVFTTVFLGITSILVYGVVSRTTVVCSRAEGNCKVQVARGPGITSFERTYPIASITRASVEKVDHDGTALEGVALVIDGKSELLEGSSNVGRDGKIAWATAMNDFLRDSSRQQLDLQRGALWPFYLWSLFVAGAIAAVLRAQTRVIIDKDAGRFIVEKRFLRTKVDIYPLKSVSAAEVARDADTSVLRLRFVDGTTKNLTMDTDINNPEKARFAGAINVVLIAEEVGAETM